MNEVVWKVAEISGPDGDVIARFRSDSYSVLGNPMYGTAFWVGIDSPPMGELEDLLKHLDSVEDRVAQIVESEHGGRLLVTMTGAGYRDLVFAVSGSADALHREVREYSDSTGLQLSLQVHVGQKFGPYASLVGATV